MYQWAVEINHFRTQFFSSMPYPAVLALPKQRRVDCPNAIRGRHLRSFTSLAQCIYHFSTIYLMFY